MSQGPSAPSLNLHLPFSPPRTIASSIHPLQLVHALQILQKFYSNQPASNSSLASKVVRWINPATPEGNNHCKTLALSVVMIGGFFLYKCRQLR